MKLAGSFSVPLPEHISQLHAEYADLQRKAAEYHKASGVDAMNSVTTAMDELQGLSVLHERAIAHSAEQRVSLQEADSRTKCNV